MRRFIITFYLIVLGFISGAEVVHLVPRDVFIGDEAFLEFTDTGKAFTSFVGDSLTLPVEFLPKSPFVTIKSIDYVKTDLALHVSVRFVPWVSGSLKLPPFPVQSLFVYPPEIRISSIIGRTGIVVPQSPREPLLVPGTTWLVYIFLGVFVLVIFLFLFFLFRILPRLAGISAKFIHNRNKRSTLRSLRKLERSVLKISREKWYLLFSRLMRRYFALRFAEMPEFFFSYTTDEISKFLHSQEDVPIPQNIMQAVFIFFSEIDTNRFCGIDSEDTRLAEVVQAQSLVFEVEALYV